MTRRSVLALGVLGCFGVLAGPASAQPVFTVVDSYGRPAAAVRIDVIGLGELLGSVSTAPDGSAVLPGDRWAEARRLSFSHLGFSTVVIQVDDLPADGVIRLEPEAVAIDGLAVVGRELCPIEPSEEARRRWSEIAARYSSETEGRALSGRFLRGMERVPDTELHHAHRGDLADFIVAWGGGVWHGDDRTARLLSERAPAEGYAWEPVDIGGIRDPGMWKYAELHHSAANHFATPAFGALHDLAIDNVSNGVVTLVFCPRGRAEGATVRGVLRFSEEDGFLNADWRFETPDRDEGAGGTVDFRSHFEVGEALPHLVAARGRFFRHSGVEPPYPNLPRTYSRESIEVIRWKVYSAWVHPCSEDASTPGGGRFRAYIVDAPGQSASEVAFRACLNSVLDFERDR